MAQSEGYKTKQRDHILQFLIENQSRHVTVDDVVDHLKQSGNPVGKATVYRYMDKLVNQGDVRKFCWKIPAHAINTLQTKKNVQFIFI